MEAALQKKSQAALGIYTRKLTTLLQSEIRTGSSHLRSPYVEFTLQYISLSPYSALYQRTCDLLRDVLHTTDCPSYTLLPSATRHDQPILALNSFVKAYSLLLGPFTP